VIPPAARLGDATIVDCGCPTANIRGSRAFTDADGEDGFQKPRQCFLFFFFHENAPKRSRIILVKQAGLPAEPTHGDWCIGSTQPLGDGDQR